MSQELEGKQVLEKLYLCGLCGINNNKRLTEKKEKVFIDIWEKYEKGYTSIAKKHHLEKNTVKVYACELFKIIGELVGEKVNQNTLRSSVLSFLAPVNDVNTWRGSLLRDGSMRVTLSSKNQEFVKLCASANKQSEAEAINCIINEQRKLGITDLI